MSTVSLSRAVTPVARSLHDVPTPLAGGDVVALESLPAMAPTATGHAALAWPTPTPAQQRMYQAIVHSTGRTSLYPLCSFGLASGGKLVLAIGAGLVVDGAYADNQRSLDAGIALVVVGFSAAFSAALMFAKDVKTIDYKLGWLLKCCSISAAALIGAGYGLRGYGLAKKDLTIQRCAVMLLAAGDGTMTVTLPYFVSYSEARRGLMPMQPREAIRVGCMAVGAGILFGWAVCANGAMYPLPASQTVTTVAVMLLTLGIALSTSDIVHQRAYGAVSRHGLRPAQRAGALAAPNGAASIAQIEEVAEA